MRLRITHFKFNEGAIRSRYLTVRELGPQLAHFEADVLPTAKFHEMSTINWPRTFARKGLRCADYLLLLQTDPNEFVFARISGSAAISEIRFVRKSALPGALQGDVLTYVSQELAVPVTMESTQVMHLPTKHFIDLAGCEYHSRLAWLLNAHAEARGVTAQNFIDTVAATWTNRKSFLRVEAV